MKYIKIHLSNSYEFNGEVHPIDGALSIDAYMEVTDDGSTCVGYKDADGNPITLPDKQESYVIDADPPRLEWML